jgi:hypothetical protein
MKRLLQFSSVLLVAMLLFSWQPVSAQCVDLTTNAGITPVLLSGNPALCIGGVRIEDPMAETYVLDMYGNTVTIEITNTACGQVFKWIASPGISFDYIVVKGGPNANGYDYRGLNPLPTEDYYLHAPVQSGKYAGLSHIDFCIKYTLGIEKTAVPTFKRKYTWEIEKTPDKEINLFTGDTYTHEYTIDLDRTVTDMDWAVSGTITITNPAPFAATITGVSDVISGVGAVSVDCSVAFPYDLAAGGTLVCTYQSALPDDASRVNTATVTTSGKVAGNSANANIIFGDPTSTEGYPTVNVTDSYEGALGSFSDDGSTSYTRTFYCGLEGGTTDGNSTSYVNRATIDETGDYDEATVTINCYDLVVTKNAVPSFDRKYFWDIEKTEDQVDCVELEFGQAATINYTVSVWMVDFTDSNWKVNGGIIVNNPAPIDAVINCVSDIITPALAATVQCGVPFPYTLVAGGTLNCTYSADLPDASTQTNTATAVLQNYDYFWNNLDGVASASTQSYSGTAEINFAGVIPNPIDECVDVSDTYAGYLGEVCVEDSPKTFTYTRDIGIFEGEYECDFYYYVDNTASFITNDTGTTDSDDAQVCFYIPCTPDCETAYAKAANGICFIDAGYADNWGWTNPITPGNYTWPLWAAAGQCITANGTQVGNVHVAYVLKGARYHVSVEFVLFPGYTLEESHVYAGYDPYPGSDIGNWVNEGPFDGTQVYVIAHGVVCGNYDKAMQVVSDAKIDLSIAPNPFQNEANIMFSSTDNTRATVEVYNMIGQKVATLYEGAVNANEIYNFKFSSPDSNQFYIVVVRTPENITTSKMLKVR